MVPVAHEVPVSGGDWGCAPHCSDAQAGLDVRHKQFIGEPFEAPSGPACRRNYCYWSEQHSWQGSFSLYFGVDFFFYR